MLLEWLSTFDAFILTHAHADHYDPDFIAELPAGVKKLIPDFIPLEVDGRIDLHADSQVEMGDVTLQFFESAHVKVPEYGFAIEYHGEALVFPTDVRDYAHAHFIPTRTRALFAHLWLGYGAALKSYEQCIDAFCAFVNSFGDCECYVAHLLETGRKITDLWSDVHFDKIKKRLPNAKKFIIGELIKL